MEFCSPLESHFGDIVEHGFTLVNVEMGVGIGGLCLKRCFKETLFSWEAVFIENTRDIMVFIRFPVLRELERGVAQGSLWTSNC